jgi:hypothetical protein
VREREIRRIYPSRPRNPAQHPTRSHYRRWLDPTPPPVIRPVHTALTRPSYPTGTRARPSSGPTEQPGSLTHAAATARGERGEATCSPFWPRVTAAPALVFFLPRDRRSNPNLSTSPRPAFRSPPSPPLPPPPRPIPVLPPGFRERGGGRWPQRRAGCSSGGR